MRPLTRRRALHGVAGILACLAGCSGTNNGSAGSHSSDANGEISTDADTYSLRVSGENPVVRTGSTETTDAEAADGIGLDNAFVTDAEAADSLSFSTDGAEVEAAREFLDATDYDAETVYIEQSTVGECYRREFCYVQWSDAEIRTSYVRRYRDADVACEPDANDTVAWFVRVPDTVDPDEIRSYASTYGSGGCRLPDGRPVNDSGGGDSGNDSAPATAGDGTDRGDATAEAER
ncbi:hypothetical protein [Halopelagius longus]|uniref:Uncharacterized protein n=1 Tax=Halopelagius longus TaxID=1236180 RepID=A0A1H1G7D5_9EURY|nr:hypothetical protein [Halopelagius longus]RDI69796.1 hypothetical protein DWB78_16735 [Halopelagius longus]SDR09117.1 hypothetical protein SAMN05216278_3569 [Halopelagius longus]